MYNLTNVTSSTNILELTVAVNAMSGSFLAIGLLIVLYFIVLFASIGKTDNKTAFLTTNFIVTFIAVLFWGAGLIAMVVLTPLIVLLMASLMIKIFGE